MSYAEEEEEEALRARGASGGARSNDVVAVWHVRHAFTASAVELNGARRLSRHERQRV